MGRLITESYEFSESELGGVLLGIADNFEEHNI
jgi:hypothetical protein